MRREKSGVGSSAFSAQNTPINFSSAAVTAVAAVAAAAATKVSLVTAAAAVAVTATVTTALTAITAAAAALVRCACRAEWRTPSTRSSNGHDHHRGTIS